MDWKVRDRRTGLVSMTEWDVVASFTQFVPLCGKVGIVYIGWSGASLARMEERKQLLSVK